MAIRRYSRFSPRLIDEDRTVLDKLKAEMEERLDMKLTDRQFLLLKDTALPAPDIPRGRPRMVSHAIGSDSILSDHHVVEGLDSGLMQRKLQADLQRKKRGF